MKRIVTMMIVITLLLSVFGCSKAPIEEPPVEPDTAPEQEPTQGGVVELIVTERPVPIDEPEPPPVIEPVDSKELTQKERAALERFRNEPKEPWGEKDISIYNVYGEVVRAFKHFSEYDSNQIHKSIYLHLLSVEKAVSYRGVMIGDDAVEALRRMDIPPQARYQHNYGCGFLMQYADYWDPNSHPYDFVEVCDWIALINEAGSNASIFITFSINEDFLVFPLNPWDDGINRYDILIHIMENKIVIYAVCMSYI